MNRMSYRLVCVIIIVLAVNFALLPAAEARGLSGSRATVQSTTDWFGAAMAWMSDLLSFRHTAGLNHQSNASTVIIPPSGGPHATPNTGSCIDPLGGSGTTGGGGHCS
jgi:hypothetical protein